MLASKRGGPTERFRGNTAADVWMKVFCVLQKKKTLMHKFLNFLNIEKNVPLDLIVYMFEEEDLLLE